MNLILDLAAWNLQLILVFFGLLLFYVLLCVVKRGPILRIHDALIFGILMYLFGSIFVWLEGVIFSDNLLTIALLSGLSAIIGAIVSEFLFLTLPRTNKRVAILGSYENFLIGLGIFICMFVCITFIVVIYINQHTRDLFFDVWKGQSAALNLLRLHISAGVSQYFAPGYIKQIRDVATPILLSALVLGNLKGRLILFLVPLFICAVAVYFSGQRLVIIQLIVILSISGIIAYRRFRDLKMSAILGGVIIILFALLIQMTKDLGRVDVALSPEANTKQSSTSANKSFESIQFLFVNNISEEQMPRPILAIISLIHRSLIAVPRENVLTIKMWAKGGEFAGSGWVDDMKTILPGTQKQLSNSLARIQGYGDLGNSPLGMPADLFYNWGFVGLIFFPFIFTLICAFSDLFWDSSKYTFFKSTKIFLFFCIPFMYSPFMFILYGGGFAILFCFCIWSLERLYINLIHTEPL